MHQVLSDLGGHPNCLPTPNINDPETFFSQFYRPKEVSLDLWSITFERPTDEDEDLELIKRSSIVGSHVNSKRIDVADFGLVGSVKKGFCPLSIYNPLSLPFFFLFIHVFTISTKY